MLRQARTPLTKIQATRNPRAALGCWLIAATLCLNGSGCRHFMPAPDPFGPQAKCHVDPTMAPQQLVARVNANTEKIQGWKSSSATISGSHIPLKLKGTTVAVEAPRNFRLLAKKPLIPGRAADMGSNDDQFWFWFFDPKQPESDVIMCNHEDIAHAARAMPIPFEPDWLMEVMGVRPIVLDSESSFVEREGYLEIYNKRVSPSGQPVQKRTTIDRCHATVVEHALLDAGGHVIAQANLSQFLANPTNGAYLPGRIELIWPQTQMQLTIQLNQVEFNPTTSPIQFQVPQGMPVRQIPPQGMVQRSTLPEDDYEGSSVQGDYEQPESVPYEEQ
jgi:hypothetical protein